MSADTTKEERIEAARQDATKQKEMDQKAQMETEPQSTQSNEVSGVEKLEREITRLNDELADAKDKFLRACADSENIRRRATIDVENAHKYSGEKFAKELLEVVDSLEKGLESASAIADEKNAPIIDGIKMTFDVLLSVLDKFGIKKVEPKGEEFDPKFHEALSMIDSDEHDSNTVVQVIQCGFTIYDRVLRPARVIVAK